MYNFLLKNIPERNQKPRQQGITMVLDKGLSVGEVKNFLSVAADYVDIIKFGWATAYITPHLKKKIQLYHAAGIPTYFGGTLFEAFVVRNQFDDYRRLLDEYDMPYVEVSDGSIALSLKKKCAYISQLAKQCLVLSEVGSKSATKIIPADTWVQSMQAELAAGAYKVIAEAREGGNMGIFNEEGEVHEKLIATLLTKISAEKIIWETPKKSQQAWFIKLLGSNVNLGNINPQEVMALETLRLGLRSDSFDYFFKP